MNKKVMYGSLEGMMNDFRDILLGTIKDEYNSPENRSKTIKELGSMQIQNTIYNRFYKSIHDKLGQFEADVNSIVLKRSDMLRRYVDDSVNEIKSWKGNADLLKVNYLAVTARDISSESKYSIQTKITKVQDYFTELNLHRAVENDPETFVPNFGKRFDIRKIELIAGINITGLHEYGIVPDNNIIRNMKYQIRSRVKTSDRETIKYDDWMADLRGKGDYPYDGAAMTVIVPDNYPEHMYMFKDFIEEFSKDKKLIPPIISNTQTRDQNKKSKILKLEPDKYSDENYMHVRRQCRDAESKLDKRFQKGRVTDVDKEYLKKNYHTFSKTFYQALQVKHRREGDIRVETIILTEEFYKYYTGNYIGHNAAFYENRDDYRMKLMKNPGKAEHQIERSKHKEIIDRPDITHLMMRIDELFKPRFRVNYSKMNSIIVPDSSL